MNYFKAKSTEQVLTELARDAADEEPRRIIVMKHYSDKKACRFWAAMCPQEGADPSTDAWLPGGMPAPNAAGMVAISVRRTNSGSLVRKRCTINSVTCGLYCLESHREKTQCGSSTARSRQRAVGHRGCAALSNSRYLATGASADQAKHQPDDGAGLLASRKTHR